MKKTLIALAALASVGAASAQSSVTLSGTVAFGTQLDRTVDGTKSGRGLTQTDAFFVLSGTEDLGGGMSAKFDTKIEANSESRGSAMNRVDTGVSLAGGFGQVALRNTRTSDLLTNAMVAPTYLPDGLYDSSKVLSRVKADVLAYGLTFGGGFSAGLSYWELVDGKATTTTAGALTAGAPGATGYVLSGGYANGPLAVNLAFKSVGQKVAAAVKDSAEFSATYDFGMAKIGFGYDGASLKKGQTPTTGDSDFFDKDALAVGVTMPFGAFTVGANYATRGDAKVAEAVAKYNFSKRTAVIASWGKQNADANQTNVNGGKESNQQYRIAVKHDF